MKNELGNLLHWLGNVDPQMVLAQCAAVAGSVTILFNATTMMLKSLRRVLKETAGALKDCEGLKAAFDKMMKIFRSNK